ncbi:MAG: SusF/SusE family outer membrane protein [Muribaculaceae bacterium]|nr:SusF/SusE family outer membrane protein [Muribaculaceae bacterium]
MNLRKLLVASMAVMALGVASAQTAVTPATGGTANPFAYALSSTVENGVIKVNYSLNAAASAASLIVKNSAGQAVITQALSGIAKGAHTASVDLAGQASDTYTWEIKVTGAAQTTVKQFFYKSYWHPSGLDVDNNPENASFGTLFVAEGYNQGNTQNSAKNATLESAQANGVDGGGLYMYTAGGDLIKNSAGNARFHGKGLTVSRTFGDKTSGADFARVAVAEDGRIFVTRHNQSGDYILSAKSVADLQNGGEFTSLVAGKTMTDTKVYTDASGNFLIGPNQGFDVKGSGANTKIIALSCANNSTAAAYSNNRTMEYNIGTATTIPLGTAVAALDKKYTVSYDRGANVQYDNRGGIWYCQYKGTPDDKNPALVYVDANGEIKYFEGAGGKSRRKAGIAVSPDGTRLAASSAAGVVSVYDIAFAADGTVSLTEKYVITLSGSNMFALTWDVAGNLYASNASNEYVKGVSIPRTNNDFTTKAASKYAVKYEAGPVVPTVTPTAGNANPFAYALSSTVENGVISINYSLNADVTAAEVIVKNSAGEAVITQTLEGITKGAHSATVDLAGQETDTYTWEIKVTGAAQSDIKEFAAYRFYHPRGVDVDNNMESAAFGNVYVTEGIKTTSATYWSGNGGGNGLYIFTPDMQPVKNPQTGLYAFMGGFTPDERVASGSVTEGADLARVRVAEDGRIFVTRSNDTGSYIAYAQDAETLIAENKFTSLLGAGSVDASTYAFNDASGNFVAGPNLGFDIKGSGENLKMMALSAQQALWVYSWKGSRIDEYALGNVTTLPAPVQHAALPQATTAPQTTNVEYDNRGGFWYCQMRQTPTDANPALVYVDANGEVKYFEGAGGKYRGGAGIRMSPDYKQIAISSSTTTFTIYDVEYATDNTPTLTEKYIIAHGIGRNLYDIAWDLAGNIYICGNSGEYLKGFSLPRENNEFTTTAASKYTVNYEAPAPVAPLYITGANVGGNWDPANAAEFTFDGSNYTIVLDETASEFKISTTKGSWDEFNAGNLAVDAAITNGGTVNLSVNKDGGNIVLPWAGVWTITVAGDFSTLTATTETPRPDNFPATIYMVGHDGAWDPANPLEIAGEYGVYTMEGVEFTNTEFKISTSKGSWSEFNANCYDATSTVAIGEPATLKKGDQNIKIAATGKYDVTIDLENMTITLTGKVEYPEVIYVLGNVNGYSWSTSEGVALAHVGDGVYEGEFVVDNADNGFGYFTFVTTLGADWDAVNAGTRYGAEEVDLLVEANGSYTMTDNWGSGTQSWKSAAGTCTVRVDVVNNKLNILEFTGVEGVEFDENAPVEYYNLNGVKVENPTNGTFIKVQGNKTAKVYIK